MEGEIVRGATSAPPIKNFILKMETPTILILGLTEAELFTYDNFYTPDQKRCLTSFRTGSRR
jgi:hypothetical protein